MYQVIQNYKNGIISLINAPTPRPGANCLLVRNDASLISAGTEKSIIELGKQSLLGKARSRPDLVRRFLEKVTNEGLIKTYHEAMARLEEPVPLGYSSAGTVLEIGNNVTRFSPGDRVACVGAGFAAHAEAVAVPEMLCSKLPANVTFEEASFGMIGIIAIHGVRKANLKFGETVLVIGLGLIGLVTVQILKAYGCRVIAADTNGERVEVAKRLGADCVSAMEDLKVNYEHFADGHGVDSVILTVATRSSEPVNIAIDAVKFGGRVVVVGVAGLQPDRNEMWHKEVELVVSQAGGPGTFDPLYENKGFDYPYGLIRWTEGRNLAEFISLVGQDKVRLEELITAEYDIRDAEKAYEELLDKNNSQIGVIFRYPHRAELATYVALELKKRNLYDESISVGVIGAGLFGKTIFLPELKKQSQFQLKTISTATSANSFHYAKQFGFASTTSDYRQVIEDDNINAVFILTPHNLHAQMVSEALTQGKNVFVEKPLCINESELEEIKKVYVSSPAHLTVGYNRRYSILAMQAKKHLMNRLNPLVINYCINAGYISPDHWVHSPDQGGGRIIGEICHFVDMLQYLTDSIPERVYAEKISSKHEIIANNDNVVVSIKFSDGSVGSISYSALGDRSAPREMLEIYCDNSVMELIDYKRLTIFSKGKKRITKLANQDMGYAAEIKAFADLIKGEADSKLTFNEIYNSTLTVFKIVESINRGEPIILPKLGVKNI